MGIQQPGQFPGGVKASRRLSLTGLHNCRDLGGYPAAGGVTRFGIFLRAEAPADLTDSDKGALLDYGVRTVIDFRGDREVLERPSRLADTPGIRYIRLPTFNGAVAFGGRGEPDKKGAPALTSFVEWGEQYADMADACDDWICGTVTELARAEGAALFNCTTGKDRTGIISALLLSVCGVCDEDIIADYAVSEVYLQRVYVPLLLKYNELFPDYRASVTDPFFRTEPHSMRHFLKHIGAKYGGAEQYLRAAGVTEETTERLKVKFIG